jgi:membrane-bound lytic murein transglycosylase A
MDDVHKLHGCNMMLARVTPVVARLAIAFGVIAGVASARAETPAIPARETSTGFVQLAADATGNPDLPRSSDTAPPADADDPPRAPLWTKYAYFVPARFSDLPGWRDDNLADAWKAFRATCIVLGSRMAWAGSCSRAAAVNAGANDDVRRFLEREFLLYQIHNRDQSPTGVITGYYEPLLQGSRRQGDRYRLPIYAVPDDLLFLDSRNLVRAAPGSPAFARVEGRNVIPVCIGTPAGTACQGPYKLDVGEARPDIRDKKLRVRIDGDRIVPYYTRAQIEQGGLPSARVLVWVDDPAALYSMQVQGSGKVRLPDGEIVRLAFAEQNGHPFMPPVAAAGRRSTGGTAVLTRGIDFPLSISELGGDFSPAPAGDIATAPPPRDVEANAPSVSVDTVPKKAADDNLSPEVERMVELLLKGNSPSPPVAKIAAPAPVKEQRPGIDMPLPVAKSVVSNAPSPPPNSPTIFSSDPSYVFFRQIPDSDSGPLGALGVPLTAGRSVAVDPRTTPLGFPVFISTEGQGSAAPLNRLMLAQDTGGAIRGPVRADYFWGFGPGAGQMAGRMKESGRMWLLLPRALPMSAGTGGITTRGVGSEAECLVPDPELCVE